jgi:predicted membrane protein
MKTQRSAILGIFLVIIGMVLLLDNLEIIPGLPDYLFTWINIFLLIAVVNLLSGNARGAFIFLMIWVFFTFREYVDMDIRNYWPLILVVIGLSFIIGKRRTGKNIIAKDYFDEVNVFGGRSMKFTSQNLQGGKSTNIFAGGNIDLRDAKAQDGAIIEVFTLFGGCEIVVPDNWKVNVGTTSIFGAFEDKRFVKPDATGPTVFITGTTIFGGGEVKSMS